MDLLQMRRKRTEDVIAMRPTDKVPISYSGPAYLAREMGMTVREYITDHAKATDGVIRFFEKHPEIDSIHTPIMCPPSQSLLWFSPVACPGKELGEDELWQIREKETILFDDYEDILKEGFGPWSERIYKERLGDPFSKMGDFLAYGPVCSRRLAEAGILEANGVAAGTPFENLCGGRGLMNFFIDLVDEPELVKKVLDLAFAHNRQNFIRQLEARPFGAWIGGWRAAPELLSHDTWMEFVWPYLKELVELTVAAGVTPILHFDSCWDSELETLRRLPEKKCLLMLDGSTDMRKARAVLDERMCLMGDVPAAMLAFGKAEEVYEYTHSLIDDVGPKTGLIVSSGCDVPHNAKQENVAAMLAAAAQYR